MSKMALCLWFDDRAEEAANFYVATCRDCGQNAAIGDMLHDIDPARADGAMQALV